MERLQERDQVRGVAAAWKRQYPKGYGDEFNAIGKALERLDVETATAEDVAAIIGNHSWALPRRCHECGKESWDLVMLGKEPDYESSTARICRDCLKAALALLDT